jgi:hypothetical protein
VRPDARPSKHSALRGPARINTLAITKLTLAVRPRGQRRDRLNLGSLRAHHAHLGSSSKQPTGPTRKPRLRIGRAPSVSCTAITLATARRSESEPADARGDWSSSKVLATGVDDSGAGSARLRAVWRRGARDAAGAARTDRRVDHADVGAWDPVSRLPVASGGRSGEGPTVARRRHAFHAVIGVHVRVSPFPPAGRGDAAADPERVGGELAELVLGLVDDAFAAVRDRGRGLVGEPASLRRR